MELKGVLPFLLILAIGANSKKLPLQLRPYIMRFNLDFKEDKIVDFISESLFATNGWITSEKPYCDVKLSDVLGVIPFKKIPSSILNTAIQNLDLQTEDGEIGNFIQNLDYTQLSYMGFSVGSVYKNFVKTYLAVDPTRIVDVLNALGIGPEFAVAYAFGSDAEMFKALQKGDFSSTALAEVETIINAKLNLKDLIKIFGLKKLDSLYFQQFINLHLTNYLASKNLQVTNFVKFLNSFLLEVDDFKDMKSFKSCYRILSQDVALGVAVSGFEIITNDDSLYQTHMALKEFTTFTISAVQSKISYPFSGFRATQIDANPFFVFEVAVPLSAYIEKATSYGDADPKVCTYVTIGGKKLVERPASIQVTGNELKIAKTLLTPFKKGSPLICNDVLYGLAATDNMFTIIFDTFHEEQKPSIDDIVENQGFMQAMSDLFEEFNINPCNYFSCSPSISTISGNFVVVPSISIQDSEDDEVEENDTKEEHDDEDNETVEEELETTEIEAESAEVQQIPDKALIENQQSVEEEQIIEEQPFVNNQQILEEEIVNGDQQSVQGDQILDEHGTSEDQLIVKEQVPVKEQQIIKEQQLIEEQEFADAQLILGEEEVVGEQQSVQDDQTLVEQATSGDQPIAKEQPPVKEQHIIINEQIYDQQISGEEKVIGNQQSGQDDQILADQATLGDQLIVEEQLPVEEQQFTKEQQLVDEQQIAEEPLRDLQTTEEHQEDQVQKEQTIPHQQMAEEPLRDLQTTEEHQEDQVQKEQTIPDQQIAEEPLRDLQTQKEQTISDQQTVETQQSLIETEIINEQQSVGDQQIQETPKDDQVTENQSDEWNSNRQEEEKAIEAKEPVVIVGGNEEVTKAEDSIAEDQKNEAVQQEVMVEQVNQDETGPVSDEIPILYENVPIQPPLENQVTDQEAVDELVIEQNEVFTEDSAVVEALVAEEHTVAAEESPNINPEGIAEENKV